jgi:hypothetical protein
MCLLARYDFISGILNKMMKCQHQALTNDSYTNSDSPRIGDGPRIGICRKTKEHQISQNP